MSRAIVRLFDESNIVEIVTALAVIGFGVFLLNPMTAIFVMLSATYSYMGSIASESTWGVLFIVAGVIQIIGISARKRHAILIGATLILFLRAFTFFGFVISSFPILTPGAADIFCWVLLSVYVISKHVEKK